MLPGYTIFGITGKFFYAFSVTDHIFPDLHDSHLWALLATEPAAVLNTGDHQLIEKRRPGSSVLSPAAWPAHFAGRLQHQGRA